MIKFYDLTYQGKAVRQASSKIMRELSELLESVGEPVCAENLHNMADDLDKRTATDDEVLTNDFMVAL